MIACHVSTNYSRRLEGKDMTEITQKLVRELFDYNHETGEFRYKIRTQEHCKDIKCLIRFNRHKAGRLVTSKNDERYITCWVGRKQ